MYLIILIAIMTVFMYGIKKEWNSEPLHMLMTIFFILLIPPIVSYVFHANDIGTIREQDKLIKVYQLRVDELEKGINNLTPKGRKVQLLLNADSPIKSMVDQLSVAISQLAKARAGKAEAIKSIAQREVGPFWFVVKINGKK